MKQVAIAEEKEQEQELIKGDENPKEFRYTRQWICDGVSFPPKEIVRKYPFKITIEDNPY